MTPAIGAPPWARGTHAATVRARIMHALPAIGLALWLLCTAVLVANAARVVCAGVAAVTYPFELDFAEGLILAETRALSAGRSIYPPAEELPNTISNYGPVYYAVVTSLSRTPADHLAVGRGVSLASALLAALVLAALTWLALDAGIPRTLRALAAASAGLAFLQISYTASFAPLMRVDLLAVLFTFAGILLFSLTAARGARVYWSLLPLLLALYTKQTAVAAAAACVLTLARVDRRRAAAFGAAFCAAALLAAGIFQLATRGGFAFHVISGNVHPYSWERAASFLQDVVIRYPVLLALALVVTPRLLGSTPHGSPGASVLAWTRAALGAYLPLVALATLAVGKEGSEVNYLIELMGVVCVGAAITVAEAARLPSAAAAMQPQSLGTALANAAVPLLLLWQLMRLAPARAIEVVEVGSPAQQTQLARLVDLVRAADGPVLSEDLTLLVQADKPIPFQPFDIPQLMRRNLRDARPLFAAIEQRTFPLVVLRFDVHHPTPLAMARFSPALIDAIAAQYAQVALFPDHWVYAPR